MREMKDSGIEWIGEIPTGWELRRAKTLFTQRNSKGNEIEVLLSPTQKYGVVPQSQLEGVVQVKEDTDLQMFKTVHKGDFVISLRSFQGGFEYSLYEGVCSPAYQVFYPTSPICDTYYRYLFKSQSFISKMNNLTVGIREGKNIQYVDFANSQIPVPPLAEQERIAAFLDAECAEIDAVLEKTRASIEEYKKLKQAVITQAVTKGIRGDRPMKDSGIEWIGEIPAGVPISRVGLHFDIVLGKMLCSAPVDDNYTLESYYCAADVHFEGLSNGEKKKMWFSPDEKEQYCVKNGDLLVVEGGAGAGGCAIAVSTDVPIYIQNSIMIVRSKGISNIRYLRYLLECLVKKGYIDVVCNKATIPHFTKDKLANVPFIIFSQSEQEEIAEYLNEKCADIDALIAKKQQYLTEIENYKKSLIYEYVTGKKEVI